MSVMSRLLRASLGGTIYSSLNLGTLFFFLVTSSTTFLAVAGFLESLGSSDTLVVLAARGVLNAAEGGGLLVNPRACLLCRCLLSSCPLSRRIAY